jgi:hypothetical protein
MPGAIRNGRLARAGVGCVLIGLAGATAAESPDCTSLDTVAWLVGAWQAESRDRLISETWARVSPITLEGRGVTRSRADGAIRDSEDLRLVAMGDGVFYFAKVSHNERPVAFRLTACAGDTLVFENAAHDFPRRIEYRRVDGARLEVHVSDGADRGFRLDFTRQPAS